MTKTLEQRRPAESERIVITVRDNVTMKPHSPCHQQNQIIEHVVHNIHLIIQTRGELSAGDVVLLP
jgi:hypothetical protein